MTKGRTINIETRGPYSSHGQSHLKWDPVTESTYQPWMKNQPRQTPPPRVGLNLNRDSQGEIAATHYLLPTSPRLPQDPQTTPFSNVRMDITNLDGRIIVSFLKK